MLPQHDEGNDSENEKCQDNNGDEEGHDFIKPLRGEIVDVLIGGLDAEFLMRVGNGRLIDSMIPGLKRGSFNLLV